jgi:hypothetical protein
VQLVGAGVAGQPLVRGDPRLGDEHPVAVVGVDDLPPLAVDLVDALLVPHRGAAVLGDLRGAAHRAVVLGPVRQVGLLDHGVRDVDAEAVRAAVQPEPQRLGELLVHVGVVPVHVRLGGVEHVQVPLPGGAVRLADPRPGVAAEHRAPVVGRLGAVRTGTVAEVVAAPLGAARARGEGGLEPAVLARGVVGDDVDDDLEAQPVGGGDEVVRVVEGAEDRLDVAVVGHVVAGVVLR